ncbi:DUF4180 domain-containing protein [Mucilaginibacter calamicampi]|uniref:DUF4180 domain-containing protein n=1 Tax=Mucilaginibacter calamicampi TaxID=1302352 RepID=A0ABW2Z4D1_9SPHI
MEFTEIDNTGITEIIADGIIINNVEDGTDLVGNIRYQGYDKVIIRKANITPDFFDLKTKLAGEILQKFSNYRVRVVILGDFSKVESKSLQDFIRESNRGKLVNFLSSKEEAVSRLSI